MAAYDRMPIILQNEGELVLTPQWTTALSADERAVWRAIREAIEGDRSKTTLGELASSAIMSSWKFMRCAHRLRELGLLRFEAE